MMHRSIFFLLFTFITVNGFAQNTNLNVDDTTINYTPFEASQYIESLLKEKRLWRPDAEDFKYSLARLNKHYLEPIDSVTVRLEAFNFDSISIEPKDFVHYNSVPIRWLNDSTFILDTVKLSKEPLIYREKINVIPEDTVAAFSVNNINYKIILPDSVIVEYDTISEIIIDTTFLQNQNLQMYLSKNETITPPLVKPRTRKSVRIKKDSSVLIFADTTTLLVAEKNSPFYIVSDTGIPKRLKMAVDQLIDYTWKRDSIQLFINDVNGRKTPFWLRAGVDDPKRYWLKNINNDSITIWIGNPDKFDISMFLEEEVSISRMTKITMEEVPITTAHPTTKLVKIEPLEEIPVYWNHEINSNLLFSQTFLSDNWAKGGESALSTLLDVKGSLGYKKKKTKWINSGRLKYGSIITKENGMRTNTDMLELNSQYNKLIKGKFDFSTSIYFKTQIAKGFKYTKDTAILTSRFLNPATFTIGLGVEYKPFKHTKINYSPLSYKNTFVLDDSIPRSTHGIPDGKKALQEMGSQLLIINKLDILDGLKIDSKLRLFSSYFNNPQNIDVDWEVNLKRQINWFFTVSANFQLIYDDDILFPVTDNNGNEVLNADGTVKKVPGLQFKEYTGLSFTFNF